MKASEVMHINSHLKLIKDFDFNGLGMITSSYKDEKILSFLADNKFYEQLINNPSIKGIICTMETFNTLNLPEDMGIIISDNPKEAFYNIHNYLADKEFYWSKFKNEISSTSIISDNAVIAEHSVKIGENCIIEPNVVIHPGTIIGNNVIIRSGSQIGTSGFQFLNKFNEVLAVKTAGRVIINDFVEIQHNCCIDRGVLGGDTIISEHVKLDNFIHVAHDDFIGRCTFIAAGTILGGRVTIGENCWLGINSTVSNGINIGDNSRVSLGAVVTKDVESNTIVSGNFAIAHQKFLEFIRKIR